MPPVPTQAPDQEFVTANDVKVRAWKLPEEEGVVRVYVHSEARQATDEQILQTKCDQFEAALQYLHEGLPVPRRLKNIKKVERKVGRLQEKYKSVAHLYEVEVKQKEGTQLAASVTFSKRTSHQKNPDHRRVCAQHQPPGLPKRLRAPTGGSRRLRPCSQS